VANKFDHKAHIPGATQEPTVNKDGSLHITARVNTYKDIDAEIKSWLPHVEILEPMKYREEFTDYLEKLT